MENWLNSYQHLPQNLDPIAFHIGSFNIGWYPLMYLAAFLTTYLLLRFRIRNNEADYSLERLETYAFYFFGSLLIGARLGYVLFYNFPFFWNNPIAIISPFDSTGKFIGIYGLSYHGGLLGIVIASWIFCKKYKIHPPTKMQDENYANNISKNINKKDNFGVGVDFWRWGEFLIPAIPAGYFFGRIGNFLNGELYGRMTDKFWGMYFPAGGTILRHPSQLYEAFFEGLLLFVILWSLRNGIKYKNKIFHVSCLLLYVFLYGFFRFVIEFFREPDPQIGLLWLGLTLGQFLSLAMMMAALIISVYRNWGRGYNEA